MYFVGAGNVHEQYMYYEMTSLECTGNVSKYRYIKIFFGGGVMGQIGERNAKAKVQKYKLHK